MSDALIYGAAAVVILLLVRRLHRKHTQAVRDRAAKDAIIRVIQRNRRTVKQAIREDSFD